MKAAFGNGRVHDRCVCRHQHLEAFTVTRKIDPDLMFERSICTTKDKNMEQNSLFVEIVWFMRFVWPCLDDSDDIRDLQWRIQCPSNFRPPPLSLHHHHTFALMVICLRPTWTEAVAFRACVRACVRACGCVCVQGGGSIYCHLWHCPWLNPPAQKYCSSRHHYTCIRRRTRHETFARK